MTNYAANPLVSVPGGDPSARVHDGRLYIYCKRDRRCRPDPNDPSWTCFSTADLATWVDHGDIFHIRDIPWASGYAFAPDCVRYGGEYLLYAPAQDHDGNWRIAIGASASPHGYFAYRGSIDKSDYDPAVFIDDDGRGYIYLCSCAARLSEDLLSVEGDWIDLRGILDHVPTGPFEQRGDILGENPFLFKRDGRYHLLASIFHYDGERRIGQAIESWIGDGPLGPFRYTGTILPPVEGNCGSSIVRFQDRWMLFYHMLFDSPDVGCRERKPCAEWCAFNEDGSIRPMQITSEGLRASGR